MPLTELELALQLIESLARPDADRDRVGQQLIELVREAGAGALGKHGTARSKMKEAVLDSAATRNRLLELLRADVPLVRSWAGSFVEQLIDHDEASKLLLRTLQEESDADAASWLAMSLARLHQGQGNSRICRIIADAYARSDDSDARVQTARAWGYAGCRDAIPVLTSYLDRGGYDQKMVALDGLINFSQNDDKKCIETLLDVMETTQWDVIRQRCAEVLTLVGQKHQALVLSKLVRLLVLANSSDGHRQAALKALKNLPVPEREKAPLADELITALHLAGPSLRSMITEILRISFPGWEQTIVEMIISSDDPTTILPLSRALAVDAESRRFAVELLEEESKVGDTNRKERIAAALKEIGGAHAFESVSAILQARYIEPSDELQKTSNEIFLETVARMRSNYDTAIRMNRVVFWLGIAVIVAGVATVLIHPETEFFGAAGVVSGLGTLVSLFFFGPLSKIQKALKDLVLIEVSFLAFMHRILQARSIFEQQYVSGRIGKEGLKFFDGLLDEAMISTVRELQGLDATKTNPLGN